VIPIIVVAILGTIVMPAKPTKGAMTVFTPLNPNLSSQAFESGLFLVLLLNSAA
jgi:hypothetical protein